jgi:hypothetical protein
MNRILGTYKQGSVVVDSPADWPDGSRVEVSLVTCASQSGNTLHEPPVGVRGEFWRAINDHGSSGLNLDDSFWPLSQEETNLLLEHMDAAEPLDLSTEEIARLEAERKVSRELQKEMVRKSWDADEKLFE